METNKVTESEGTLAVMCRFIVTYHSSSYLGVCDLSSTLSTVGDCLHFSNDNQTACFGVAIVQCTEWDKRDLV